MRRVLVLLITPIALAQQPSPSPFLTVPAVSDSLQFGEQLPEFEAKDTAGRTWTLKDLRGKLTLIYVWHTSMARAADAHDDPWRQAMIRFGLPELPELERFYKNLRASKKVQVLTFCRDYDYTHASDYMNEKGYTFPVIADWLLIRKLFPNVADVPYALVDPEGRLSHNLRAWSLGRVLLELERAQL